VASAWHVYVHVHGDPSSTTHAPGVQGGEVLYPRMINAGLLVTLVFKSQIKSGNDNLMDSISWKERLHNN